MALTPSQRGAFGDWLQTNRSAKFKSQGKARAEVRRLTRVDIPVGTWRDWESGARRPRPDDMTKTTKVQVDALLGYFGGNPWDGRWGVDRMPDAAPPGDTKSPTGLTQPVGLSDLVALQGQLVNAFEVQAQAVMALADEIRQSRAAEYGDVLARMRALEATVRLLHPELDTPESEEPSAPPATGGSAGALEP